VIQADNLNNKKGIKKSRFIDEKEIKKFNKKNKSKEAVC
jgi:hypothetical protein